MQVRMHEQFTLCQCEIPVFAQAITADANNANLDHQSILYDCFSKFK